MIRELGIQVLPLHEVKEFVNGSWSWTGRRDASESVRVEATPMKMSVVFSNVRSI